MSGVMVEYSWAFLVIIALEGLLAADNALVMAIMVKHLPIQQIGKALFYGLAGAFVLRFGALFLISFVADLWEIQALGAAYLLYMSISHLMEHQQNSPSEETEETKKPRFGTGFWATVAKVELADIAFAVDSILAALAIALGLPHTTLPNIGGLDGGQFGIVFLGGFVGLICVRFAATYIIRMLRRRPRLETAAYSIVGWVGMKLAIMTLAHPQLAVLPGEFPHSALFKIIFWGVLVGMAITGWYSSKETDSAEAHDLTP